MREQHRMLFRLRKREIKLKMGGVCTNGAELLKATGFSGPWKPAGFLNQQNGKGKGKGNGNGTR